MSTPSLSNQALWAREALKQLTTQKLPPTPENYTRVYLQIAGLGDEASPFAAMDMLRALANDWARGDKENKRLSQTLSKALAVGDWQSIKRSLQQTRNESGEQRWSELIRDLLRQWDNKHAGLTQARKRESIEHVLTAFSGDASNLHNKLRNLTQSWASTPANRDSTLVDEQVADIAPTKPAAAAGMQTMLANEQDILVSCRELIANTLNFGIVERLGHDPDLQREAQVLAQEAQHIHDHKSFNDFAAKLRRFWITLEIRGDDQKEIQQGLLRLLRLVMDNVTELLGEDEWLKKQMQTVQTVVGGPLDRERLAALEAQLREVVYKQSALKLSLDQSKNALKDMLATFIDRLGTMSSSTGNYYERINSYAQELNKTNDLPKLNSILQLVMQDTRSIQTDIQRSRDELLTSRQQVNEYQKKLQQLEQELESVSQLVREDQLTATLNRRGLENAYQIEVAKAERNQTSICLAVLDVDNFKQLNDALGHQVGDQVLVHLARMIRISIRPSDIVARYGGEEFVILLPNVGLEEAMEVMRRVQRQMTKSFFLHQNQRVLVTFSAGVALRQENEAREALIERADRALYEAKRAGKNRVMAA